MPLRELDGSGASSMLLGRPVPERRDNHDKQPTSKTYLRRPLPTTPRLVEDGVPESQAHLPLDRLTFDAQEVGSHPDSHFHHPRPSPRRASLAHKGALLRESFHSADLRLQIFDVIEGIRLFRNPTQRLRTPGGQR